MDEANPGTVLVTGAFGQVGSRCTEILLSRGRTVVALDLPGVNSVAAAARLSERAAPGTLVPAYADLTDAAAIRELVAEHQPTAIVHLAGILAPTSYRNPKLARKVNVEGTRNVVDAAKTLAEPPLFVEASSASVYGSINPYRYPDPITPATPIKPIDQYGEDKMLAEAIVRESGLPYAMLRLGGVISPDGTSTISGDHLVLTRATPGDNRMHTVDGRDVALAFANAVDRRDTINGKVLLIAGDDSHRRTQRELEDDMMETMGIGRLGPSASLPGDPEDDRGWAFTGFFDTAESQALLDFQQHDWSQTRAWIRESQGRKIAVVQVLGPLIRPLMRLMLAVQRKRENRGRYADPWTLIEQKFGPEVLASADV
jgi:nucleoside-diphosphate-sugar epimerase